MVKIFDNGYAGFWQVKNVGRVALVGISLLDNFKADLLWLSREFS
jgi:hypothetical protein